MEAADSTTNSSKVIVQCHDPNNLFESVVPKLESRLPLNKLHWKSPNRPLRSIDQLHVSFVRDDATSDASAGARRHQIPGLRQTPFVKVYLVRCDDREIYKETCRKEIKQWLKSQGFSQDGKNLMKGQERHDAYEYIILHVVFPGTAAAAQPRSSKHISIEASESTDSLNSKSKWGKSSSTLFDKLRADFSSSSKAPFERVAQIRLTEEGTKQTNALGPSEIEEQWQDLVEKLKTAILLSFDARVSQYEDDIRDRESQRQLPGWNFCTFFVLKEGLARGFGHVGLIDDALTLYEELDAGLDTLVQDQASRDEPDPTSALLPFSSDLKPVIREALDNLDKDSEASDSKISDLSLKTLIELEKSNFPFDVERRQYQQRILTNQVSALDFHIYIFTRQLQLLFRQARVAPSTGKSKNHEVKAQYDLNAVAAICEKATSFIALAARSLRRDLYAAWGGQEGLSNEELNTQRIVIGGIVASWKWSAVMQILADCKITSFLVDVLVDPLSSTAKQGSDRALSTTKLDGQARIVRENISSWAGELLKMASDVIRDSVVPAFEDSSQNDQITGLQSRSLRVLWASRDAALDISKLLNIHAYQCFESASRVNASRSTLHALAKHEVDNGDIDQAVWWLEHVQNLSDLQARTSTDRALLKLYAECLKDQGRLKEYVRVLVGLLSNTVANPFVRAMPRYDQQSQSALDELVRVSENLPPTEMPFEGFITIDSVDKGISHQHDTSNFSLSLSLSLRFNASFEPACIELTLSGVEGHEPNHITMKTAGAVVLNGSVTTITLHSNLATEGWYDMTQLTTKVGNLSFVHLFRPENALNEGHMKSQKPATPTPIMIYPRKGSMTISARPSPVTDLTQAGRLRFELSAGEHDIRECMLRIRPATAGVRLDVRAMKMVPQTESKDLDVIQNDDATVLLLQSVAKHVRVEFEIPYTTETLPSIVAIKIEAEYKRGELSITAFFHRNLSLNLPISVNVQDIFQLERLYSRFTAVPSTYIPLRVLSWKVEDTEAFQVRQIGSLSDPVDIFQKLPTSWVIEAVPRHHEQRKMPLSVHYQTYDDIILRSVESQFRKDIEGSLAEPVVEYLVSYLISHIPVMWNEQDLEAAVLMYEYEMFSYELVMWREALRALNLPERALTETWLRTWHAEHSYIKLDPELATIRQLKLSVEMPKPSVLVSTLLHPDLPRRQYLVVGEPIQAELRINCVCDTGSVNVVHFEMNSPPETWLVGGKRKGSFESKTQSVRFDVILIPQRQGHLLLPSVDIRCRQYNERGEPNNISIEVESRSQAKSVLVINDVEHTTVAIGADGPTGRYWPIDGRRRQQVI